MKNKTTASILMALVIIASSIIVGADKIEIPRGKSSDVCDIEIEKFIIVNGIFKKYVNVSIGDTVIFGINLTNTGNTLIARCNVTDYLPDGLTYLSSTIPPDYVSDENVIYWSFLNLTPYGSKAIRIYASADTPGEKNNVVCAIAYSSGGKVVYDNSSATVFVEETSVINISLYTGWNVVTIPVENSYTASSLYADIPGCNIILIWNTSIQNFDVYVPGSPYDYPIENGKGYIIGMSHDSLFSVTGDPIQTVNISLQIGWNMLGWFKEQPTTASSICNSIPGCTLLMVWNTTQQDFNLYIPGGPVDFLIHQGDGFLVAVNQESIWNG